MKKNILLSAVRFAMIFGAALTLGVTAAAQSNRKSNTTQSCYNRLDCIPAQGRLCCVTGDSILDVLHHASGNTGADQQKSKFTLANKSGGSNALRTGGGAPNCSTDVTVVNAAGAIQAPNTWYLQKEGEVLVVNLSGLPKGKYLIKMQSGKDVNEYEVAPRN